MMLVVIVATGGHDVSAAVYELPKVLSKMASNPGTPTRSAVLKAALHPSCSHAVSQGLLVLLGVFSFKLSRSTFSFIVSGHATDPYCAMLLPYRTLPTIGSFSFPFLPRTARRLLSGLIWYHLRTKLSLLRVSGFAAFVPQLNFNSGSRLRWSLEQKASNIFDSTSQRW